MEICNFCQQPCFSCQYYSNATLFPLSLRIYCPLGFDPLEQEAKNKSIVKSRTKDLFLKELAEYLSSSLPSEVFFLQKIALNLELELYSMSLALNPSIHVR